LTFLFHGFISQQHLAFVCNAEFHGFISQQHLAFVCNAEFHGFISQQHLAFVCNAERMNKNKKEKNKERRT